MSKRCFTFLACEFESDCQHAAADPMNGYFEPGGVGEHCNHFKARTLQADIWHTQRKLEQEQ